MAAQMRADRDVFQHGHVGHQFDMLKRSGDAEFYDLLRGGMADLFAEHGDRAARGGEHAGDQVERRAFAGAIGTDQRHDLAGLDVERDVVDRDHAAELFAGVVDLQEYVGRDRGPRARGQDQRRIGSFSFGPER